MAISEDTLLEIKYKMDIESVISPYVNLKRRGKNLVGLCPFHNEKTPSFTVYPENGSFYCFGCGVGGDIFTFIKQIENLDYIEAVKFLADRAGVTIPDGNYDDSLQRLKKRIYDINRDTARFYHNFLMSPGGKWALDYLMNRGLSIATIKHFGLGAAPDSWSALYDHLKKLGYKDYELEQANVITKSSKNTYYDRFRNRVMFPIINLRGNVIAFSGRIRSDSDFGGKYVNSTDTPVYKKSQNLFGINFAKNCCADRVILVEGNMDVISLHQAGFENTVAPMGTAFTQEQAKLLSRYTKEIVVTLDSDAAGQKAVMRALDTMKNSGIPIRVLVLPECKDPDEYIKKFGAARFKRLLDGAVSDIEYKFLRAAEGIDLTEDDGRLKYLKKSAEILAELDDYLAVDLYAGRLSEKYGVSKTAILSKVKELKSKNDKARTKKEIKEIVVPKFDRNAVNPEKRDNRRAALAEETVISVLMQHPDLINLACDRLKPEDMITDLNRRIYERLIKIIVDGRDVDISLFGEQFSNAELGYIAKLQNSEKAEINSKDVLKDCIEVILKERMLISSKSGNRDMTVDEWQDNLKKIIELKKGE